MDLERINLDNYILYLEDKYLKRKKEFISLSINAFIFEEKEILNNDLEWISEYLNGLKSPIYIESVYMILEQLLGRIWVSERDEDVVYRCQGLKLDFEDLQIIDDNSDFEDSQLTNDTKIVKTLNKNYNPREESILVLQEPYIKKLTEMKHKVIDLLNYLDKLDISKIDYKKRFKKELHQQIFVNNGFLLFEYILNNYVSENKGRKADLNFYYRKLYKAGYIIESCEPKYFRDWYEITFNDDFGQIKTISEVYTDNRNTYYDTSLEWFKQQTDI
ncbi:MULTISPECIES: hypothetical protein [unclassified Empedobacter]|uniref:hypothetical protein n=1 Tax=unclassified Empedobacter TaxID=2643773 RepID=UPI0025C73C36|nr:MULTISPECIES: hypothetical protein [unclassified Empedobacter]